MNFSSAPVTNGFRPPRGGPPYLGEVRKGTLVFNNGILPVFVAPGAVNPGHEALYRTRTGLPQIFVKMSLFSTPAIGPRSPRLNQIVAVRAQVSVCLGKGMLIHPQTLNPLLRLAEDILPTLSLPVVSKNAMWMTVSWCTRAEPTIVGPSNR